MQVVLLLPQRQIVVAQTVQVASATFNVSRKSRARSCAMERLVLEFNQYLAVANPKFQSDIGVILRDLDKAILMDDLDGEKQARSQFLYSFLSSFMKGRPLTMLKNIGDCNGLEILKNLVQTFQPPSSRSWDGRSLTCVSHCCHKY